MESTAYHASRDRSLVPAALLKKAVQASYDQEAANYVSHADLQSANLSKLLSYLSDVVGGLKSGSYLDVGCGAGIAVSALQRTPANFGLIYLGVDLSPVMIKFARRNAFEGRIRFEVADAEDLPVPSGSYDVVLSNSVLHWLNQPKLGLSPLKAVQEIARVLRPSGHAALSIAGTGTGRRFREAFRHVMRKHRDASYFDALLDLDNPVGLMNLDEIVQILEAAGMPVGRAQLDFEPQDYASALDYAADVKAYGFGVFLAPIVVAKREEIWAEIVAEFLARVESATPYRHDQYMAYVIARRPE